jgi:hypothetical protein
MPTPPPAAPLPPKTPIYTPPPGEPPKKSSLPWILGGCGCLTLLLIIATIAGFAIYRAKQRVTDFKADFKSALKAIDEKQSPTPSIAPRLSMSPSSNTPSPNRSQAPGPAAPKMGWSTYVNVKENLPSGLQPNFVAFTFNYPKSFNLQPQSDVNFVKVEKYAAAGKGNTSENFAVGYAWFDPPNADSEAIYNTLLDQLGQQLSGGFHNYKELRRAPETVDGVRSRAALFQADFNDPAKTMIYGKTIVVHPSGKKNGVTILILGTSLSRDIKSAEDLGTKGDTAEILRSFKFL